MYERPTGAPPPKPIDAGLPADFDPFAAPGSYHRPNHFSRKKRIANCLLAVLLVAYGGFGVYADDLWLPGKQTLGVHLHGTPAWLMYGAFLCAASVLLALVVDHYDRRNNEHHYERFKKSVAVVGWVFFSSALLWNLFAAFSQPR